MPRDSRLSRPQDYVDGAQPFAIIKLIMVKLLKANHLSLPLPLTVLIQLIYKIS
jgi:hypothetical protein